MSALDNIDDSFEFDTEPSVNDNPMPDVMTDLETMGTRPDAPIIAIGAVTFNLSKLELGERFYVNVDLASSVALGSVIDPDTVMWWLKQDENARKSLLVGKRYHVCEALGQFESWLSQNMVPVKERRIWGCGPDFDCVLLSEHFRKAGREVPWMFWNQRDFRTLKALYPNVEMERTGTHHNALDDAVHQVEHLFKIKRALRGNA